ncbi:MAG: hypothetical protein IJS08_14665 [Victivallales bacterium]|nr:hypothetical protein [Victivallales bacterium]
MTQPIGNKSLGAINSLGPILPSNIDNPQGQVPVQQPQEQPVQQPLVTARSLTQKLDEMLFKVAQSATYSVNSKKLHVAVSSTKLSSNQRAALTKAADYAAETFKALSNFTGREIADALVVGEDNKIDWGNSTAGNALKKAIDAQANLSEKLHDIVNSPKVSGEAFETLSEMALQADRRQTEIMMLALQLADTVEQNRKDSKAVARLNAKVEELLPRQALQMHGTDAALEKIKAELQPLADRLDSFASRPNASISSEEFTALQRETALARNALERVAKEGFATPDGGRWMPDKTFFSFAKLYVDYATQRLADTRKEIGMQSMECFVEKAFTLSNDWPIVYQENLRDLSAAAPTLAKAANYRYRLLELARNCVNDPTAENMKKLQDAVINYSKFDGEKIVEEVERLKNRNLGGDMDSNDWDSLLTSFRKPQGMIALVQHLLISINRIHEDMSPEKFLSTDSARALLEGRLAFSTIVEARIHGMKDADVNPKLDVSNMVSSKKLGNGVANTVYLVKYKDNSEYVFKPEAAGRLGMETLKLSMDNKPEQQVAELNLATQKTAEALGLEDIMPKTTVGSHNGQYGLFMEKAPGRFPSAS